MQSDEKEQFNNRLSDWVARQGIFFQLRYSMAGGGVNMLTHHILIVLLKLLVLCGVCGVCVFLYLVQRPEMESFQDNLRDKIISNLDCTSGTMDGFSHRQGKASIRYLTFVGGENSFFTRLETSGISLNMSIVEGFKRVWKAQNITIDRLSITVKAGAETAESAALAGKSLFKDRPDFQFDSITVKNARVNWGYSENTKGSIAGSNAVIKKTETGWIIEFTNGTFEQNWLRKLTIKKLNLRIEPGILVVEKAEFVPESDSTNTDTESKKGEVTFHQFKVSGSDRPSFSGAIRFKHIPLDCLLLDAYSPYIDGRLSGEVKIGGSTNSSAGVELDGRIALQGDDHISLKNRLPLLSCLSIINPTGDYGKMVLSEGYFQVKTSSRNLSISELFLTDKSSAEIRGEINVRPPTTSEIEKMLNDKVIDAEIANHISPVSIDAAKTQMNHLLKINDTKQKIGALDGTIDDQKIKNIAPFSLENQDLETQSIREERIAQAVIFSGNPTISFPSSKFPANNVMFQKGKLTTDKTKLELGIPLKGRLNELTLSLAEELLKLTDSPK
jgi:hypothetical protein